MRRSLGWWRLTGTAILLLTLNPEVALGGGLEGKVKKEVYYSPAKNFSVPVPLGGLLGKRMEVSDHFEQSGPLAMGGVAFRGDLGDLEQILYGKTLDDFSPANLGWEHWLHKVVMSSWFLVESAESRVIRETHSSFKGMKAYLALVEVPQGSSVVDMKTGQRRDSRRGMVLFERPGWAYGLVTETLNVLGLTRGGSDEVAEDWSSFAEDLESFYDTIQFLN